MLDLALLDQLLDRASHVLHRHIGVNAMLVEQIDAVGPQPLQSGFGHFADALRPAVLALCGIAVLEAELGSDHHLVAKRLKRFAEQFLIGPLRIGFRRVEEGDATVESGTDELNGWLLFGRRPIAIAEAHAAKADGRDFEAAFAEFAFLQRFLLGCGVVSWRQCMLASLTDYRSMAASRAADNGAPLMSIVAKAWLISRRSCALSLTSTAGRLSSTWSIFVPPGIGTIQGFWASSQAGAICAGVIFFRA